MHSRWRCVCLRYVGSLLHVCFDWDYWNSEKEPFFLSTNEKGGERGKVHRSPPDEKGQIMNQIIHQHSRG